MQFTTARSCQPRSLCIEPNPAIIFEPFGTRNLFTGDWNESGSLRRELSAVRFEPVSLCHGAAATAVWHRENLQISGTALFRQSAAADHDGRRDRARAGRTPDDRPVLAARLVHPGG